MEKWNNELESMMTARFGKDQIIALATVRHGAPQVRNVDAYYENKTFYVITYALSNKMEQIAENPAVAVAGEWFTAHGRGENLGYFGRSENAEIAGKLRTAFAAWIDNGHNDFSDENTCILAIRLTDGLLFADGACYEIDFSD